MMVPSPAAWPTQLTVPFVTAASMGWGSAGVASASVTMLTLTGLLPSLLQRNVMLARVAFPSSPFALAPASRTESASKAGLQTVPFCSAQPSTSRTDGSSASAVTAATARRSRNERESSSAQTDVTRASPKRCNRSSTTRRIRCCAATTRTGAAST